LLFDLPDLDEEFFLPGTGPELDKWNVTDCTQTSEGKLPQERLAKFIGNRKEAIPVALAGTRWPVHFGA
jgi:hypothetical protein